MDSIKDIQNFLNNRPEVIGAFGYGSGVFKQSGYKKDDKPQLDLILIVDDMKKWHKENIKINPKDYSFSGNLYLTKLSSFIPKLKTGISYQSNIEFNGRIFKYGIIEKTDFLNYMESWESFYVPGRFQKPIKEIKSNDEINAAIKKNRIDAIKVALLIMNNQNPNINDLYETITGLSYYGDIRMLFAENPNKISNIVSGSIEEFDKMYKNNEKYFTCNKDGSIDVKYDNLFNDIPTLPTKLCMDLNKKENLIDIREELIKYMEKLNRKESIIQPAKGILTNGPVKSLVYVIPKFKKKFQK